MKPKDIDYNEILDIAIQKQQNPRIKRWYQDNRDTLAGFIREKVEAILAEELKQGVSPVEYVEPKWKKGQVTNNVGDVFDGWVSNVGWATYKDDNAGWYLIHEDSGLSATSRRYKKDILQLVDDLERMYPGLGTEEQDALVNILQFTNPWLGKLIHGKITFLEAIRLSKMTPEEIEQEEKAAQEAQRIKEEQPTYKKPKWKKGTIMRSTPDGKEAVEGWVSNVGWATYKDDKEGWYLIHEGSGASATSRKYKKDILELVDDLEQVTPGLGTKEQDDLVDVVQNNPWLGGLIRGTVELSEAERLSKMTPEEIEQGEKAAQEAQRIKQEQAAYEEAWKTYKKDYVRYKLPIRYDPLQFNVAFINSVQGQAWIDDQRDNYIRENFNGYSYKRLVGSIGSDKAEQLVRDDIEQQVLARAGEGYDVWYDMAVAAFKAGVPRIRRAEEFNVIVHNYSELLNPKEGLRLTFDISGQSFNFFNTGFGSSFLYTKQHDALFSEHTKAAFLQVLQEEITEYGSKAYASVFYDVEHDIAKYLDVVQQIDNHKRYDEEDIFDKIDRRIRDIDENNLGYSTVFEAVGVLETLIHETRMLYESARIHTEPIQSIISGGKLIRGAVKSTKGEYLIIGDTSYNPALNTISWNVLSLELREGVKPKIGKYIDDRYVEGKAAYTYHAQADYKKIGEQADYKKIGEQGMDEYDVRAAWARLVSFLRELGYKEMNVLTGERVKQAEIKEFIDHDSGRLRDELYDPPPVGMYQDTKAGKVKFIYPEPWQKTETIDGTYSQHCPLLWINDTDDYKKQLITILGALTRVKKAKGED